MKKNNSSRAFSLVEVVLALGVTSFAMVSLMGLMACGFSGLRQSIELSTQAQIIQGLVSQIDMLDFSQVNTSGTGFFGFPRYYDDEGKLLASSASASYAVPGINGGLPGANSSLKMSLIQSLVPGGVLSPVADTTTWSAAQIDIPIVNLHSQNSVKRYCIWAVNNGR